MKGRRHIAEDRATRIKRRAQNLEEPTARTGRQALADLLYGLLAPGLVQAGPGAISPTLDSSLGADSTQPMNREWRLSLGDHIFERLEHSVAEGELPESADIEVLTCLCISFASGLRTGLEDGISPKSLADTIAFFVESVGFHKVRAPRRRPHESSAVGASGLKLVKC